MKKAWPDGIDLSIYDSAAFVDDGDFKEYMNLRRTYLSLVSGDIENHEGFCTFMEYAILKEIDPKFGEEILRFNMENEDHYGKGFRKLRRLESDYDLSGVIDYLMGGCGK